MLVPHKEFENESWPLRYFVPSEFACRHCGKIEDNTLARQAWHMLDRTRHDLGYGLRVVSGTRCEKHNENVGGVSNSFHLLGRAFDVQPVPEVPFWSFEANLILLAGRQGFLGVGLYPTFVHLDNRSRRTVWANG